MNKEPNVKQIIAKASIGLLLAVGLAAIVGYFFMQVWNSFMPSVFGAGKITVLQGLGLLLLLRILFWSVFNKNKDDEEIK